MIILPHPVPEGLAGSGCLCKRVSLASCQWTLMKLSHSASSYLPRFL